jgi:hypothetical protein
MLRRSPRFRKGTSDPKANKPSIASGQKVSDSPVNVEKDFRPLLWQHSSPQLSECEISFPTPQPAPSTALFDEGPKSARSRRAAVEGFRVATFVNWKVVLRRLPVLLLFIWLLITF